jgi:hypothetical protein
MSHLRLQRDFYAIRALHCAEGWAQETIAEHALPALGSSFIPLDISGELFA